MNFSRRKFLQAGGASAALAASAGCGNWKNPAQAVIDATALRPGPFQPPSADAIDPITHVLNRLSFGTRPGEYERIRKLGKTPEEAARAYIGTVGAGKD